MRRRRKQTEKTAEQIREAAREALRRHRARRKAQKDELRGAPSYRAVERAACALRKLIFDELNSYRVEITLGELARALFDGLGPDGASSLIRALLEERKLGGTAGRRRRFAEKYGPIDPAMQPERRTTV